MTKKGLRTFDCRAAVERLAVVEPGHERARTRLDLVLRHQEPAVRPDDVLGGVARAGGLAVGTPVLVTRQAQGPLRDGEVGDPFAS